LNRDTLKKFHCRKKVDERGEEKHPAQRGRKSASSNEKRGALEKKYGKATERKMRK